MAGYVLNELVEAKDLMHWKCGGRSKIEIRSLSIVYGLRLLPKGIILQRVAKR